jgi:hypothetical protein
MPLLSAAFEARMVVAFAASLILMYNVARHSN